MAKKEKSKINFYCSVSRNSAIHNYSIGGKMKLDPKLQDIYNKLVISSLIIMSAYIALIILM